MNTNEIKNKVQNMNKENANALMAQIEKEAREAGMNEQQAHEAAMMFVIDAWLGKTKYN